jgi:hypothetical protein
METNITVKIRSRYSGALTAAGSGYHRGQTTRISGPDHEQGSDEIGNHYSGS